MDDLKQKFLQMQGLDNYQRVDASHPVDLFVGLDNTARYSLFCITKTSPEKVLSSSRIIAVFVGKRRDGTFGITFSLTDQMYLDHFVCFCTDMIRSSRDIRESTKTADFICSRYIQWQKAFARNNNGLLSPSEIKGLIGEMCFIQKYMIPKFGESAAISSWCGPEMSDRDFEYGNTWYEVKSTVSGSPTVSISSVEQLDTDRAGHLAVVILDKTSAADDSALTLNKMYYLLRNNLSSDLLKQKLDTVLLSLGYYENEAYNNYYFHYNGITLYRVDAEFPCIRKTSLPSAAQSVRYDLSLSAIQTFKED
jgi:hypothetical protein